MSKNFFFSSIRFKAVFLMALMVTAIALFSGFYFSWHAKELIFDSALERVETIGDNFSFNAEYGLLLKDREILSKLAKGVALQESVVSAIVLDAASDIISREPQPLDADSQQKIKQAISRFGEGKSKNQILKKASMGKLGEVYVVVHRVFTQSKQISEELTLFEEETSLKKEVIGYAVILFSPDKIYAKVKNIQMGILLLLGGFSLIIMVFVFFTANFFVRQLRFLLLAAQKIGQGDLSVRLNIHTRDELEELGRGFNQMAETLEKTTVSRDALVKEIEERKRMEQAVLQSEKMAAIGQLAGGVAHEINNPLGVILGFAQHVVKRIQPGDPLELPLTSIEREAIRCKNLVQDLLTFSRVSKIDKEPVNMKEAIEVALSLVLAQSKVKNIELVKDFLEVPEITGNKNQIQQIVINLCNNAMDAMPKGGKLIIHLQRGKIDGADAVEIQVQDTGQGIPPEIRDKIFNPFFTTKEIGKGTGLGLSLVYEIVQKHNGRILLESKVGNGTTFQVFLPVNSRVNNNE